MEIKSVEAVIAETNAVVPVGDNVRNALVQDLGPIAGRLARYEEAALLPITCKADADLAAHTCAQIADDIKAVKNHDVLSHITAGLHGLHRRWTGLVNDFVSPMDKARRQIKANAMNWEAAEREKAEAEQRRLQAVADEQARKERERLEKLAEARKTPELKEAYREQAAAVAAPVIQVAAPKVGIRRQKRWAIKSIDYGAFYTALSQDESLRGFVDINATRLNRAQSANPSMRVPGVVFHQITV